MSLFLSHAFNFIIEDCSQNIIETIILLYKFSTKKRSIFLYSIFWKNGIWWMCRKIENIFGLGKDVDNIEWSMHKPILIDKYALILSRRKKIEFHIVEMCEHIKVTGIIYSPELFVSSHISLLIFMRHYTRYNILNHSDEMC